MEERKETGIAAIDNYNDISELLGERIARNTKIREDAKSIISDLNKIVAVSIISPILVLVLVMIFTAVAMKPTDGLAGLLQMVTCPACACTIYLMIGIYLRIRETLKNM